MTLSRRDFAKVLATAAATGAVIPRSLIALQPRRQETFFDWRAVNRKSKARRF